MKTEQPQITVGQLMFLLRQFPEDAFVYVEGCDCLGEAVNVSKFSGWEDDKKNSVMIERNP